METYRFTAFKINKDDQNNESLSEGNPFLDITIPASSPEAARNEGIRILLDQNTSTTIDDYVTHISNEF